MLSHLRGAPCQGELASMPVDQSRGRLEGIVEPEQQIPVNKELLSQQGAQIGQRPAESGAELQILQQQHGDECCPNLGLQRVGRSSDKGFDAEQLLQRLEKRLNLPALL